MIRFVAILLLLFKINFGFSQVQAYQIGDTVNNFSAIDVHGNNYNLYDECESGKYVYIKFFTTNCSYCQYITPFFNEFYEKYGCGNGDISCVSVNGQTDDAGVLAFEQTYSGGFSIPPAISTDGGSASIISRYNPNGYPTVCLIAPDKKILELEIWPISGVEEFEAVFPDNFNPEIQNCTMTVDKYPKIKLEIFPNPIDSESGFKINVTERKDIILFIYNTIGNLVYRTETSTNSIIQPKLTSGIYWIQVNSKTETFINKLIIK
jgi:thiol-disulfide isomerase/thioredoxin